MVKPFIENIFTDRPKVVLLLWIIFVVYVLCLSCFLNYEIVISFILDNYVIIIMDHKITWICFLSILSISLPTRKSGIRRDKYLSVAIFK